MSLDQYYHFVAVGQFCGLLEEAPGVVDTRHKHRKIDAALYDGLKGVHSKALTLAARSVSGHQAMIRNFDEGIPSLPNSMTGAAIVYSFSEHAVDMISGGFIPPGAVELANTYRECTTILQDVVEGIMLPVMTDAQTLDYRGVDSCAILFKATSELMLQLYMQATSGHRSRQAAFKRGDKVTAGKFSTEGGLGVYSLGSLVILKWGSKEWLMTPDHFRMASDQMLKFRNLTLLMKDIILRDGSSHFEMMRLMCSLGEIDQSHVGAAFRVLRAWAMAKGADHETSLSNVVRDAMRAFSGIKKEFGERVISAVTSMTDSYTEMSQLGNVYKYVVPPDISMQDCFEAAHGMKQPNKAMPAAKLNFRGLLRKRLFLLLIDDKSGVHAESPNEEFNTELNRPTPNRSKLEGESLAKWSEVTFQSLRSAKGYKDVKLRTNDKSSANEMVEPPMVEISGYNKVWLSGEKAETLAKVRQTKSNDVLTALVTGERLNPKKGYKKFTGLVAAHERLERKLMLELNLTNYMDIPSEKLAEAILADPKLYYTVNTEPKYKELHKPAGRLFYMATREMKAFISSVERLCRTVFHGQVGNSIVTSYMKREAQLRAMARSTSHKLDDRYLYFVSFDMSEFSKKFPMELVNEIGEVFAELTGDDSLRRLDVIFRAGIVVHSTRGFEGVFAGVKGGFEGFLNFVWTTAHVTIMELALINAQKQGVVMAYSDDGLLEFSVPRSMSKTERNLTVSTIQSTYLNLGLVFHLFKTLVTTNIFEYLGLVAKDGRYIDGWGKALANLGIKDKRSSFTPFTDLIDTCIGQCSAVVEALCPVDQVYYHMILDIYLLVRRRTIRLTCKQIMVLALLPRSLSGLGVPSQMAMSMTSERPGVENFLHTALTMSDRGDVDIGIVLEAIYENISSGACQKMGYVRGDYLTASLPKLDPSKILARLAEAAAAKAGLKEIPDPITPHVADSLMKITRTFKNFPLEIFAAFVASSPAVQDYESRLEMATSRGAFSFIGRQAVKEAQSEDSRNVINNLGYWARRFEIGPLRTPTEAYKCLFKSIHRSAEKVGFSPARLKPESLMYISRDPKGALACATLARDAEELLNNPKRIKKLDDAIYNAPDMTSGMPDHTPVFDTTDRLSSTMPDKMVKVIGRLFTICPEGLNGILAIASVLGARIPSIPSGIRGNLSRLRAQLRGKASVIVRMPQTAFALTTITPMKALNDAAANGQITDYSTHIMTMKVLMGFHAYRNGDLRNKPCKVNRNLWFHLLPGAEVRHMCYEPDVTTISDVPESVHIRVAEDRGIGGGSGGALMRLLEEMRQRATIVSVGAGSAEFRHHVAFGLALRLARRIHMRLHRLPTSIMMDHSSETDDERMNESIRLTAYLEVARLNLCRNGDPIDGDARNEYVQKLDSLQDELPAFMTERSFHECLHDGSLEAHEAASKVASMASMHGGKATVLGDLNHPKVYREAVSRTVKDMYTNLFKQKWRWNGYLTISSGSSNRLVIIPSDQQSGRCGMSMDDMLDGLTAMMEVMRASSHRSNPYNVTSFHIHMAKLSLIAARLHTRHGNMSTDLSRSTCALLRLTEQEMIGIRLRVPNNLGPDHAALIASPLGAIMAKRVSIYARMQSGGATRRLRYYWANPDRAYNSAMHTQHFIKNCITRHLSVNMVQISTNTLRSSEVSNVLTGRWQLRNLNLATSGNVQASDYLLKKEAAELLAANMILLRNHTTRSQKIIQLTLPRADQAVISAAFAARLGKHGVNVIDSGDGEEGVEVQEFEMYPGENSQRVTGCYAMIVSSTSASELVSIQARLGAMSEIMCDIVRAGDSYMLVGALVVTTGMPEGHGEKSSDESSETSVSQMSRLEEGDAKLMISSTLAAASLRRKGEAGLMKAEEDPISLTVATQLSGDTGIGASRRGGWECRVLPGEIGLAASVVLAGPTSSPQDMIKAAALAWASLGMESSSLVVDLIEGARQQVDSWENIISTAAESCRCYVQAGVWSEIAGLVCWLRRQNFRLPVEEHLPTELTHFVIGDYQRLIGGAHRLVIDRFTASEFPIDHLRSARRMSMSFVDMSTSLAPPHEHGHPVESGRIEGMGVIWNRDELEDIDELSHDESMES